MVNNELYMIMVDGITVATNVVEQYLGVFVNAIFDSAKDPVHLSVVIRNMRYDDPVVE